VQDMILEQPSARTSVATPSARERAMCEELSRRVKLVQSHRSGVPVPALRVVLPGGSEQLCGHGEEALGIHIRDASGLEAMASFDELRIAEAYLHGHLDLAGSLLPFFHYRDVLSDRNAFGYLWTNYLRPRIFGQAKGDEDFIGSHYDEPPEFFELWLDKQIRSYSHGFFEHDDETLEQGMLRKFQYAIEATHAKPGDRVLDIGGGWGSFVQHGGTQGLHVTSITISDESEAYIRRKIQELGLTHCSVHKKHLLEFQTDEPFDAIVNLGVSEHLPDYPRTIAQYSRLLKPGGRLYLDAYSGEKFGMSKFVMKWVFQSNTSPLNLPEYLGELAKTDFEVVLVQNDRHNYYLSCKKWAENLNRHQAEITRRWGALLYRRFHLYLWSAAHAFADGALDAHRLVLQRPAHSCGRHFRPAAGRRKRLV
jgi:cyclopropane-fatty-acyl-phospholipid synthase